MKALEEFGLQGTTPLSDACAAKYGGQVEAAYAMKLEARRRRYAATAHGLRVFPANEDFVRDRINGKNIVIPRPHWGTRDYVAWFEAANHLKGAA